MGLAGGKGDSRIACYPLHNGSISFVKSCYVSVEGNICEFLAHLSGRLIGELIVYQ